MKNSFKNPILDNLESLLCLNCEGSDWQQSAEFILCGKCQHKYVISRSGKVLTVENHIMEENWEKVSEGFNLLKGNEHPIRINKIGGPRISQLRKILDVQGLSVNLGSGQDNYSGFLNLDLGDYSPVHVIADFTKIPLVDESIQLVACNSVLEHIYDYEKVVREITRITKKGGFLYLCVPLISIRHHKYDYHRWTSAGLKNLVEENFTILESGACRGVAYSMISYIDALLTHKVKNTVALWVCHRIWRILSFPLLLIKDDSDEEYQALANTIYVLAKKN